MSMLFVFTAVGLVLFVGGVAALMWAIRSGQMDDLDTPALRVLTDDAAPRPPATPAVPPTSPGNVSSNEASTHS